MKTSIIEFYKSRFQWRWRITASNGRIIASSSEGFWKRQGAEKNLRLTHEALKEYFEPSNH